MNSHYYAIVLVVVLITFIITALLYLKTGMFKRFYHDFMEWHLPDENIPSHYDGCSIHSKCKYCGKDITQDSQGNWY